MLNDPEFLVRLQKYCNERGLGGMTYFLFLAALKDCKEPLPVLEWLRKENLITKETLDKARKKLGKQQ